ncbi:MAG: mandelate racemase [Bryobacteraceae bacterium]|nr:mandelate racemase [Bryobacteraceae bacterium]
MLRRSFLKTLASLPVFAAPPAPHRITAVELVRLHGRRTVTPGVEGQYQVQPLHIYPEFRPQPYREQPQAPREAPVSAIYLSIRTDRGGEGLYGPIDQEAAILIETQFRHLVLGRDAFAVETVWDVLYRSNRHFRSSHPMMAISAIDNCLWDLRGRVLGAPVYRLLGGPTRNEIEAYGSALGYPVEPDAAARRAAELKEQGFRCQKWFFAHGPGDGPEGLRRAVDLVFALRLAAGQDVDLMFDAYMGWTLDFAIAWAKRSEQYNPRWIEEAFPPDQLDSFAALRRATSIPVAAGEHLYNRWEVKRYLDAQALNVVQADPEWCGGVSELLKICHLASAAGVQVIPHGHSLHAALHVVAAQSPAVCPMVEYLILKMRSYYHFEKRPPVPVRGRIELPDAPGFGIEIDPAKVEKREAFRIQAPAA